MFVSVCCVTFFTHVFYIKLMPRLDNVHRQIPRYSSMAAYSSGKSLNTMLPAVLLTIDELGFNERLQSRYPGKIIYLCCGNH